MTLEDVLSVRPSPGQPRDYRFPAFERIVLDSGLQVLTVNLPGRPLVSANLIIRRGAADEPPDIGGVTGLAARAATEGTERYKGVELIEAAERLGATLHADASWDSFMASVDVAASRLGAALELLDELVERPTFPEADVARLRDERLNDLLQVKADPRRRVERAFTSVIYAPNSPYSRPAAGDETTVPGLDSDAVRQVHRMLLDPSQAALVVGGDLTGLDVPALARSAFAGLAGRVAGGAEGSERVARPAQAAPAASTAPAVPAATTAVDRPIVRFYHHPGAVQTELRIGHVGVARKVPDFHAIQLMAAILGGLFNSRLQMNLREEKGYTYGIGAGFEMRRAAGPFAVRTAVQTAATIPSISESLIELNRMRDTDVTDAELRAARDYLGRLPAPVRDARGGRCGYRRSVQPGSPRRRARALPRADRGRDGRRHPPVCPGANSHGQDRHSGRRRCRRARQGSRGGRFRRARDHPRGAAGGGNGGIGGRLGRSRRRGGRGWR